MVRRRLNMCRRRSGRRAIGGEGRRARSSAAPIRAMREVAVNVSPARRAGSAGASVSPTTPRWMPSPPDAGPRACVVAWLTRCRSGVTPGNSSTYSSSAGAAAVRGGGRRPRSAPLRSRAPAWPSFGSGDPWSQEDSESLRQGSPPGPRAGEPDGRSRAGRSWRWRSTAAASAAFRARARPGADLARDRRVAFGPGRGPA